MLLLLLLPRRRRKMKPKVTETHDENTILMLNIDRQAEDLEHRALFLQAFMETLRACEVYNPATNRRSRAVFLC